MDEEVEDKEEENRFFRSSRNDRRRSSAVSLEKSHKDFHEEHSIPLHHSLYQYPSSQPEPWISKGAKKVKTHIKSFSSNKGEDRLCETPPTPKVYSFPYVDQIQEQPIRPSRNSSSSKFLRHDCKCVSYCFQTFCPCFNDTQQMCISGFCCENCIKNKLQILKKDSRIFGCVCQNSKCQNLYCKCYKAGKRCDPTICNCQQCENRLDCYDIKQHQHIQKYIKHSERVRNLINERGYSAIQEIRCSCKKSTCLKDYCCCFYYGVGCGPSCRCKLCRNIIDEEDDIEQIMIERERYGRIDSECEQEESCSIDKYLVEENYQNKELPGSMEFQHPNIWKH